VAATELFTVNDYVDYLSSSCNSQFWLDCGTFFQDGFYGINIDSVIGADTSFCQEKVGVGIFAGLPADCRGGMVKEPFLVC
jgi:hypothetical protein